MLHASKESVLVRQLTIGRVRNCVKVMLLKSNAGSIKKVIKRVLDILSKRR